ncbi:MAG: acetylglutamate kinase [Clostridiales bacterium]|jgi:acetylglutamate kinase|nr:acetylglutamate kinase [Clostridiales bacterium]
MTDLNKILSGTETINDVIKKAEILIESLPYIQRLYGATVVIKYGGNAMINDSLKNSVMQDITLLKYIGMNPVVVHGGGPDINEALDKFNVKSKWVNGLRVTDKFTMEIAQMVLMGKTNKEIVSNLNKKGGKAVGFCGIDGNVIQCEKHMEYVDGKPTDIGYVGKITAINTKLIDILAKDEYIPVIAPIGVGPEGESYNINADIAAGEIAAALKAEKLMLLTDIEGVKNSNTGEIHSALTIEDVHKLIDDNIITGGMIPKVMGCVEALNKGLGRTHIIDGRIPHCLLLEIFTNKGIGTMIMKDRILYYENEQL